MEKDDRRLKRQQGDRLKFPVICPSAVTSKCVVMLSYVHMLTCMSECVYVL